jgi:hypothetical protein
LSNGFSKKAENDAHSVAIHFMYYNFVRIHQTLRIAPAMAAGVTTTLCRCRHGAGDRGLGSSTFDKDQRQYAGGWWVDR